jgi:penicillin G amidase
VSDAYPYLLGTDFAAGYRAQRINEMIRTDDDGISIEDIQAIQGDNLNIAALDIIPLMHDLEFDDPAVAAARDRLEAWDGQMHMDSPEAALYALFWAELVNRTFNDQLPADSLVTFGEGTYEIVYYLIDEPDNAWWDYRSTEDEIETRDDILAMALERGYAKGVDQYGANLDEWRWGELHPSIFRNETIGRSGIDLIESIWNRGPVATSGGSGMVNATSWSSTTPFEVSSVPSMRQIIDLGDLANSLMIHTTGQSGHPGHPHYDDFIDMWRLIQYHPTLWDRNAVEDSSPQSLTLNPNK